VAKVWQTLGRLRLLFNNLYSVNVTSLAAPVNVYRLGDDYALYEVAGYGVDTLGSEFKSRAGSKPSTIDGLTSMVESTLLADHSACADVFQFLTAKRYRQLGSVKDAYNMRYNTSRFLEIAVRTGVEVKE